MADLWEMGTCAIQPGHVMFQGLGTVRSDHIIWCHCVRSLGPKHRLWPQASAQLPIICVLATAGTAQPPPPP